MKNSFITNIDVVESRNLFDFKIPLSKEEKKHLIITGKNGSGKTSLLEDVNKYMTQVYSNNLRSYGQMEQNLLNVTKRLSQLEELPDDNPQKREVKNLERQVKDIENWFNQFGGIKIDFSDSDILIDEVQTGEYIIAYFNAKRESKLNIPGGVKKISFKKRYNLTERANKDFIQYIVNLKADRSFARDDNEHDTVKEIDKWFENFENNLKQIIGNEKLKLKFDRKTYNFLILENNKKPYSFTTLSDGYSAIISIVTELLLRMEAQNAKNYNLEGIVLIDEIETHLHVDLQKKVLPFLINFFPRIQFIVTTHSPFILSSIQNAVICDLESKLVTDDLSGYSYDSLIESYFSSDKYSNEVKAKLKSYEELMLNKNLTEPEKEELYFLKNYFSQIPKYSSKELTVKLQQIELQSLNKKEE